MSEVEKKGLYCSQPVVTLFLADEPSVLTGPSMMILRGLQNANSIPRLDALNRVTCRRVYWKRESPQISNLRRQLPTPCRKAKSLEAWAIAI